MPVALRLPPPRPPLSRAQVRKLLCGALAPELGRVAVDGRDQLITRGKADWTYGFFEVRAKRFGYDEPGDVVGGIDHPVTLAPPGGAGGGRRGQLRALVSRLLRGVMRAHGDAGRRAKTAQGSLRLIACLV